MDKTITTDRLLLRAFTLEDSLRVKELAGEKEVARMTENIPHPYPDGLAEEWIGRHEILRENQQAFVFAITLQSNGELLGTVSLFNVSHTDAELGFWLGLPYWGHGYCSEAGQVLIAKGFEQLQLSQIRARTLTRNKRSEKVLLKLGFRPTSEILEKVKDELETVKYFALSRNER
ncbi:GNAT family N-acetyltransferase [Endozoicomonas arenosclerae]|uniref:GNAT family N-acetyltransferase n=1 Tax=Endozoicomonas arenosclerae TaxID=1633495 RepID=UPI00078232AE|nr:GNAT family N-acetyltransferase [Endozoicomonas arenosclerae]